jgi:hypothetical protein
MRLWIKLHVQLLDDPKVAVMPDPLFRTFINLMAVAGRVDQNGKLGTSADIAYWLRKPLAEVEAQMATLEKCNVCVTKDDVWRLKNWQKFNKVAASNKPKAIRERVQKSRENKRKADAEDETSNALQTRYERVSNAHRKEKNREEKKVLVGAGAPSAPVLEVDPVKELAAVFEKAAGVKLPTPSGEKGKAQVGTLWWHPLRQMVGMSNGNAAALLQAAIKQLRDKGLNVSSPNSCLKTFTSLNGAAVTKPPTKFIEYSHD